MSASPRLAVLLCLVAFAAPSASAADLPPDLALVLADAAGFMHLRVGDAIRSDNMKEFREVFQQAGPKAIAAFSKRFTPDPLSFDRLTVYVLPPDATSPRQEPEPVVIFRMSKPFDAAALAKTLLPGAQTETIRGVQFVGDKGKDIALRVVDNQTFFICPVKTAERAAAAPKREGPLASALARAGAAKHVMIAAVNAAVIPPQALAMVPPPFTPLAQVKMATFSVELAAEPMVEMRLHYIDADAAAAAEQTARGLIQTGLGGLAMARGELDMRVTGSGKPGTLEELPEAFASLLGLGAITQAEAFLKELPLRREGTDLALAVKVPQGMKGNVAIGAAVLPALLLPAIQKVREAASRTQGQNNLKQIALAMHNFHDAMGAMPGHAIYSKDGKTPLLSWRVAILPYVEQDALYRQFKLDEPWDSEHNKRLIPMIPKIYIAAGAPPAREPGMTHYRVFVGPGAGFDRAPRGRKLVEITDGTSNTIMIVESNDPVTWTKPDDIAFGPQVPLVPFTPIYGGGVINVAFFDGSVRAIKANINPMVLIALITVSGGEVIDPNALGGR